MSEEMVKVAFTADDGTVETMWAKTVGDGLYELRNSPFFQYGVSLFDIVKAAPDRDGFLEYKGVHAKSGHRTIRVMLPEDRADEHKALQETLRFLGGGWEGASSIVLSVTVPPDRDLMRLASYLNEHKWPWEHADPIYDDVYGET